MTFIELACIYLKFQTKILKINSAKKLESPNFSPKTSLQGKYNPNHDKWAYKHDNRCVFYQKYFYPILSLLIQGNILEENMSTCPFPTMVRLTYVN